MLVLTNLCLTMMSSNAVNVKWLVKEERTDPMVPRADSSKDQYEF